MKQRYVRVLTYGLCFAVAIGMPVLGSAIDGQMLNREALKSAAFQAWSCSSDTGNFRLELEEDGDDVSFQAEGSIEHEGSSYAYVAAGTGTAYGDGFDTVLRFENNRYLRSERLPEGLHWQKLDQMEITIRPTGGEGNYDLVGKTLSEGKSSTFYCN
jgi:hypothetical protein